jgi:hypothetical protein
MASGYKEKSHTMKTIKLALAAFPASGAVMHAQETQTPKVELAPDYSWLYVNLATYDFQRTGNGGSGYLEYNISSLVGLVGGAYAKPGPTDDRQKQKAFATAAGAGQTLT